MKTVAVFSITDAILRSCCAIENKTFPQTVMCYAVRGVAVSYRIRSQLLRVDTAAPATPVLPCALLKILCVNPPESSGTPESCSVPAET